MKYLMLLAFSFAILVTQAGGREVVVPGIDPDKTLPLLAMKVRTSDGKAVTNATVICVGPETNAVIKVGSVEGGNQRLQTDGEGLFRFKVDTNNIIFVVAGTFGFGLAQSRDFTNSPTIIVERWGRIEGTRLNWDQPVSDAELMFQFDGNCLGSKDFRDRLIMERVTTDSQGRFVIEQVPPLVIKFWEHMHHPDIWNSRLPLVNVRPGETTRVTLATQGRTIVGHLDLDSGLDSNIDVKSCFGGLASDSGHILSKPRCPANDIKARTKWWLDWYKTDAGREFLESSAAGCILEFHEDGSFIGEMVGPGKYRVNGSLEQNEKRVAELNTLGIEIPQTKPSTRDQPFDIGAVPLRKLVTLQIGDVAPDFTVNSLDGKPVSLADFRGRYVMLDFWATWCGPCVAEMPRLIELHKTFAQDKRLAMISLSLDQDRAEPAKFIKAKGISWTQLLLGEWSKDNVTRKYGVVGIPEILLIGPDGRIAARGLRGEGIKEAVEKALGKR